MSDNINETAPTEPIPPVAPPVAEPVAPVDAAPVAEPVYAAQPAAPAAPVSRGDKHVAMIVGGIAVAVVLAIGVFAAGAAVGGRMSGGQGRQYAISGQRGPGMMQGQQGQFEGRRGMMGGQGQSQGYGRDFDGDQGYGQQGYGQGYGRHSRGGYGAQQGFGGQGSVSPTASVPAVPGQ